MPIKDRSRYPKDWSLISVRIKDRARWLCECKGECGLHPNVRCIELHKQKAKFAKGKIILTVAHLNHKPEDCREENLRAMCQRCHLRYDLSLHIVNARKTRDAKNPQMKL